MAEFQVKALYDFENVSEEELNFATGEILTIVNQDVGEGWWEAKNSRGERGLIPYAYVETISMPEPKMPPPPLPPASYLQNQNHQNGYNDDYTTIDNWNDLPSPDDYSSSMPPPSAPVPSWSKASSQNPNIRSQDSCEEWDDDWDDDDDNSSTTTETPSNYVGNLAVSRSSQDVSKFPSVRKNFTSKGGEALLFGPLVDVPCSERVNIIETADGPVWQPLDHTFGCRISCPKKSSKFHGMKSFISYTVTPSFSNIQTSRRYKHFDWLHGRLLEKYPVIIVPPLPDKQISGRYEDDFINERMRQLQLWIDRMCRHPIIAHSEVFQHFLTCTDEKRWKVGKRKAEKDEFQSWKYFLTIQTPVSPINQKDSEDQMDRFTRFVKSMEDSVKHFVTVGEAFSKKHQTIIKKEYHKLGHSFISLAKSFEFDDRPRSQHLTSAIEHTGKIYDEIGQEYEKQAKEHMNLLLEKMLEYKGILSMFPEVLGVQKVGSVKYEENYTKMSESEAQTAQGRLDTISYATLAEMNHFDQYRTEDFKNMTVDYLNSQIEFHQEVTRKLQETLSLYNNV